MSLDVLPQPPDKLAEGFPLPLLKRIQLYDPVLQIHKVSGFSRVLRNWGGGLVSFPGLQAITQWVGPSQPCSWESLPGGGMVQGQLDAMRPSTCPLEVPPLWGQVGFDTTCVTTFHPLPPRPPAVGDLGEPQDQLVLKIQQS